MNDRNTTPTSNREGMQSQKQSILEISGVDKTFGGLVAIHQLSFNVSPGEIVAIIGPNGSGKTTLFNLISGFLSPTRGEIRFDGQNLGGLAPHHIASKGVARTFQLIQIFTNMSIIENVMAGRHLRSRAGMFQTAFRLPPTKTEEKDIYDAAMRNLALVGLETNAQEQPLSLPYGKQKLLEIARALATEPRLIMMDEPAGGLSTREIEELARLVYSIRDSGITVLLVEHRMELALNVADRVIVLNFGEKIAEGPPSLVQTNEQVIAAYLGEEF